MSSTITCGKRAAGYRTPGGVLVYLLFENTYESNVYPHAPHWSTIYFGYLPGALKAIFGRGSSCEGGMLRNRSAATPPENYIAAWLRKLASPEQTPDALITLECLDSWRTPLPLAQLDAACAILQTHNYPAQAETLRDHKTARFQLHDDAVVLVALCDALSISPWRFLEVPGAIGDSNPALGYKPKPATNVELPPLTVYKADRESRLVKDEAGVFRCIGWQYAAVGHFVEDLWRREQSEPGGYKTLIPAFRAAMANANALPSGAKVEIDASKLSSSYEQATLKSIQSNCLTQRLGPIIEAIPNEASLYHLCSLPSTATAWILPV